ncbi:hypothetical protein EDD22DRAFT_851698 [Suillus occidentalis]|nr:hypothetical protein EDD22DRAFT_851698 [Suillus occidentalis]
MTHTSPRETLQAPNSPIVLMYGLPVRNTTGPMNLPSTEVLALWPLLFMSTEAHSYFTTQVSPTQPMCEIDRFDIAKHLILSKHGKLTLEASRIEDLCLAASRKIYDNASSANYKVGDMKLAYDCNADTYKHTQVMLDLLHKLGFRDDVIAEVKTFAMVSDVALQAEDFTRAFDMNQKMIDVVFKLRSAITSSGSDDQRSLLALLLSAWAASRFPNIEQKLTLMGRVLELCPADKLNDILIPWR